MAIVSHMNFMTAPRKTPRSGFVFKISTPAIRSIFPIIIQGIVGARTIGSVPLARAAALGIRARRSAFGAPNRRVVATRIAFTKGPVIHCWWSKRGNAPIRRARKANSYVFPKTGEITFSCICVIV